MEQIPVMLGDTRETEIVLAPVVQAGLDALKVNRHYYTYIVSRDFLNKTSKLYYIRKGIIPKE